MELCLNKNPHSVSWERMLPEFSRGIPVLPVCVSFLFLFFERCWNWNRQQNEGCVLSLNFLKTVQGKILGSPSFGNEQRNGTASVRLQHGRNCVVLTKCWITMSDLQSEDKFKWHTQPDGRSPNDSLWSITWNPSLNTKRPHLPMRVPHEWDWLWSEMCLSDLNLANWEQTGFNWPREVWKL